MAEEELLAGAEAAKYLAEKWGIASYSPTAFRMLRKRWKIAPDLVIPGNPVPLWRKSTLDKIPKPDRTRPRSRTTEAGKIDEAA